MYCYGVVMYVGILLGLFDIVKLDCVLVYCLDVIIFCWLVLGCIGVIVLRVIVGVSGLVVIG